jgi:flagellar export protein FliJ
MKAFRFSLEAVRTLRQRQENEALEQYARALLARQQVLDTLDSLNEQITRHWAELRRLLSAACGGAQAAQAHSYHHLLEQRRDECVAALGQAERRVNAASHAMLAARQQREMVDVYCAKQQAHHQHLETREEQKTTDEFASRRATSIQLIPIDSAHE